MNGNGAYYGDKMQQYVTHTNNYNISNSEYNADVTTRGICTISVVSIF